MTALSRIGDMGEGTCKAGHPDVDKGIEKPMTTTFVTGARTVFTNNLSQVIVGSIGTTDCGHVSEALTGVSTVFAENMPVHSVGDVGIIEDDGGGEYTSIMGSPNVFAGGGTSVVVPKMSISPAVQHAIDRDTARYVSNPSAFKHDSSGQVKGYYAGTPNDGGAGASLIDPSAASAGDIAPFLSQCLEEAAKGLWRESGQGGNPSNPNIVGIWKELGYPSTGAWASDQTAWCMGFVNFVLKRTGYRYVQTAWALDIASGKFGATQVPLDQGQPGDIALWSYRHVNFVYSGSNGRYSFVGGNQSPKASNNPADGDITNSWPNKYTVPGNGSLVSLWRPVRK